ncbi:sugar phosphate isomerase/epimerase, partial [Tateyamaria sp. syn59]|uniref:sugar phosphate isomerase/epimerase family protein n=1 Tax=Tateyamaria sp. syn59 TaxID=2576942 RepID=UPI0011BDEDAD
MRVGIGTFCFRWSIGIRDQHPATPMGPVDFLEAGAEAGADFVQFAENLDLTAQTPAEIETLGARADETGLGIQLGTNRMDDEHLARQVELADFLGAAVIRIAPNRDAISGNEAAFRDRLRYLGDVFGKAGCTIALENHFDLAPVTLARIAREAAHERVTICVDVANSVANGEWPTETVATLAPHAGNLHIKDYDIVPDSYGVGMHIVGTRMGEGRMDLDAALTA